MHTYMTVTMDTHTRHNSAVAVPRDRQGGGSGMEEREECSDLPPDSHQHVFGIAHMRTLLNGLTTVHVWVCACVCCACVEDC